MILFMCDAFTTLFVFLVFYRLLLLIPFLYTYTILLCKKGNFVWNTKNTAENEETIHPPLIPWVKVTRTSRKVAITFRDRQQKFLSLFSAIFSVLHKKLHLFHYKSMLSLASYCLWICVFLQCSFYSFHCSFWFVPHIHQKSFHCLYDSFHVCCFHYIVCFCSSSTFYNWYHLCIHIWYCHEDHLDSMLVIFCLKSSLQPYTTSTRVKVVSGNHCLLVIIWGLLAMMKALWGVLTAVTSSYGHVVLYQSLWKISYDFPGVLSPYNWLPFLMTSQ